MTVEDNLKVNFSDAMAALRGKDAEIERLQAELTALREYMQHHAPMELRAYDVREK